MKQIRSKKLDTLRGTAEMAIKRVGGVKVEMEELSRRPWKGGEMPSQHRPPKSASNWQSAWMPSDRPNGLWPGWSPAHRRRGSDMPKAKTKFKPGDRVQSTETGAYGTYLGGDRTHFDACDQNGRHWPAKVIPWGTAKLKPADENDPKKAS